MGNLNMKLMRGIEEAENQMQKEKQPQKAEEQEKVENETKDTQKAAGKPQKAEKQPRSKTSMRKKVVIEPDRMSKKQIFSFRAVVANITIWRAYAVAKGETVENLGNAAMEEYLKRHKLSGTELAIFEALKTRDGIGKE